MRRVLFLSYYFPPLGGAGVQRSGKFVRYLPSFGFEPVVVTGPGTGGGRWAPSDRTLVADTAGVTDELRIPTPPPGPSSGWQRRAERWLRLPAPFSRWWVEGAVQAGAGAGAVDVIYASMSPFETAEAAARLSRRLGRPWVADLRDPWALDEMMVYPSRLHRRLERRRMRRALGSAAAVVMNTAEAAAVMERELGHRPDRLVTWIPNGFDAADFAAAPPDRPDGAFRIVHTGYFHTDLGLHHRRTAGLRRVLGGARGAVDFLGRSHVYLLEALERVMSSVPGARDAIELHLAGSLSDADTAVLDRFPHRDRVRLHGYLPHAESVELVRSADLLFFPMHELPPGTRSLIVPGKAYEYLASNRPILAAVPDGDARELMAGADRVHVCRPLDSAAMAAAIAVELDRHARDGSATADREALLREYERRHLTRRLADVLDGAAGRAED
jgi:hypothetical protein